MTYGPFCSMLWQIVYQAYMSNGCAKNGIRRIRVTSPITRIWRNFILRTLQATFSLHYRLKLRTLPIYELFSLCDLGN